MKPTLIELIPVYGMFKYFNRYFKADKRGNREVQVAQLMEIYHMVTGLTIAFTALFYLKIFPA